MVHRDIKPANILLLRSAEELGWPDHIPDPLPRSKGPDRSIRLRNPYVDPMNAIQVELLRRHRAGDESARLPLMRSIAGIAAALRNTG